jgi:hypothetical protein
MSLSMKLDLIALIASCNRLIQRFIERHHFLVYQLKHWTERRNIIIRCIMRPNTIPPEYMRRASSISDWICGAHKDLVNQVIPMTGLYEDEIKKCWFDMIRCQARMFQFRRNLSNNEQFDVAHHIASFL